MRGICKSFPGVLALDNVDLSVEAGEVHCLIGANGAGKSTLMKVLSGVYSADGGEIFLGGKQLRISSPRAGLKAGIAVIYQELSLVEHLTVAENIFLGQYPKRLYGVVDWAEMKRKSNEVLQRIGVPIDPGATVSSLSMGHKQIVELCKALAANASVVVMDEPSAALSEEEFKALVRIVFDLKKQGVTILYISHRLEELFQVGDSITVLRDGKLAHTGKCSDIDIKGLVRLMIGHDIKSSSTIQLKPHSDRVKLKVSDLGNHLLQDINFSIYEGEILGLYGLVGSGRSEILHSLFGAMSYEGEIALDGHVVKPTSPVDGIALGLGLIPEQRKTQGLILDMQVWENAAIASNKDMSTYGVLQFSRIFAKVREYVKKLHIKTPGIMPMVRNLSGGNQQKVVITKWLMKESDILMFDEPTQGIDVGAKEEVYQLIRDFAGKEQAATVVASSELEELEQTCHRILVLYEGRIVGEFTPPYATKAILHTAITGEKNEAR